jgi:hypothetical protein
MEIEREEIVGAGAHHRLHAVGHEGEIMDTCWGLCYTEEKAAVGSS